MIHPHRLVQVPEAADVRRQDTGQARIHPVHGQHFHLSDFLDRLELVLGADVADREDLYRLLAGRARNVEVQAAEIAGAFGVLDLLFDQFGGVVVQVCVVGDQDIAHVRAVDLELAPEQRRVLAEQYRLDAAEILRNAVNALLDVGFFDVQHFAGPEPGHVAVGVELDEGVRGLAAPRRQPLSAPPLDGPVRSLLCNLIDQPILPTDWIALNHDQVDLFLSNGGAA